MRMRRWSQTYCTGIAWVGVFAATLLTDRPHQSTALAQSPSTSISTLSRLTPSNQSTGPPSATESVQLTQFIEPPILGPTQGPAVFPGRSLPLPPNQLVAPASRSVRVFPRSSVPLNLSTFPSPDGTEQVGVIDSGHHIVIGGIPTLGTIDISTDRLVIWTSSGALEGISGGAADQPNDIPLEFYMEGNIVFRTGQRVIYANSMYYDVHGEQGVVLDAEVLSDIPKYAGLVRLKADVLRSWTDITSKHMTRHSRPAGWDYRDTGSKRMTSLSKTSPHRWSMPPRGYR